MFLRPRYYPQVSHRAATLNLHHRRASGADSAELKRSDKRGQEHVQEKTMESVIITTETLTGTRNLMDMRCFLFEATKEIYMNAENQGQLQLVNFGAPPHYLAL